MNDSELQSALGKLLEDPESLARIMGIANSLMGSTGQTEDNKDTPHIENPGKDTLEEHESAKEETAEAFNLSALPVLLGKLGSQSGKNDPNCALLTALKPFMAHGRAEKIDSLIRALKMAEAASGLLKSSGIFNEGGS